MTADLPKIYGPYKAIRLIGRGGMGCVYEAIHTQIQRRVALKVLSDNLAGDRKLATRFLNEARAVNIVSHPSLVIISDFGEQDGIPFIVMEYLEGQTLSERVKSLGGQTMPPGAALLIARQVASGLDAAHTKGIVHRGPSQSKPPSRKIALEPALESGWKSRARPARPRRFHDGVQQRPAEHSWQCAQTHAG